MPKMKFVFVVGYEKEKKAWYILLNCINHDLTYKSLEE